MRCLLLAAWLGYLLQLVGVVGALACCFKLVLFMGLIKGFIYRRDVAVLVVKMGMIYRPVEC